MADRPSDEGARLRPARRTRLQETDRQRLRGLRSGQPAGGLDEVEAPAEPPLAQHPVELADVGGHERLHVGVCGGGRGAFVLVDLRVHVARNRHRQARELGPDEIPDRTLVDRVLVGMQEADRERLYPVFHQLANLPSHGVRIERLEHRPVAAHPLRDLAAVAARGQRLWKRQEEIVDVVALLRPHLQDVPEAASRQQPEPRAVALDDGVGHEGGAVHDVADVLEFYSGRRQQIAHPRKRTDRGILRRRQALVQVQPALLAVHQDEVGEGTADVEADAIPCRFHVLGGHEKKGPPGRDAGNATPKRGARRSRNGTTLSHKALRCPRSRSPSGQPRVARASPTSPTRHGFRRIS